MFRFVINPLYNSVMFRLIFLLFILFVPSCLFAGSTLYTTSSNNQIEYWVSGNYQDAREVFVGGGRVYLDNGEFNVCLGKIDDNVNNVPILIKYADEIHRQDDIAIERQMITSTSTAVIVDKEYSDLKPGYWSYEIVSRLTDAGIVSGNEKSMFMPRDDILYTDLIKWISNAAMVEPDQLTGVKDITARKVPRLEAIELIYNNLEMLESKNVNEDKMMDNFLEWKKMPPLVVKAIHNKIINGASDEWVRIDLDRYVYRDEAAKLIYYTKQARELIAEKTGEKVEAVVTENKVEVVSYRSKGIPNISKLKVHPKDIVKGSTKYVTFVLKPIDNDGVADIKDVMIDPYGFSKVSTMQYMLDSGDWGDVQKGDYEYALQLPLLDLVSAGKHMVDFYVTDKKGWQSKVNASFNVLPPRLTLPSINRVNYNYIDGKLRVTAIVFDQGNDIAFVALDLSNIGLSRKELMKKDDLGEYFYEVPVNYKRIKNKKISIYVQDEDNLEAKKDIRL